MGDPRAPGTSDAGNTWTEKLKGNYELPFSIKIPEFAESPDGEQLFRLPHTFTDRASWGSIEYYLELRISRGKLRSDDRINASFELFTLHPPSPPQLRQLAYRTNVPIPGPHSDLDGWQALEPVQVRGKLFGDCAVNAKCTVFFQNRFVGLPTVPVYTVVRLRLYGYRNRNRIDTSKDLYRIRLRSRYGLCTVITVKIREEFDVAEGHTTFAVRDKPLAWLDNLAGASGRYQQSLRESFNRASEKSAHCRVPGIEQNLNDCLLSG
ncbi:hypothetical protein DFH08DRAFT_805966 [Mycena albidolilacea]|uniref:Arrestin-like N-terminal domain-containing protein n=1 Tax=Mycena albidolilacea TaxID=1033008 RepID=A0AAD7EVB7_9AGAR|nr:hypothetical protein DFH08DRAFT_805966 [Mycena albidolilacea]